MTLLEMGWGRIRHFDILRITGLLGWGLRKHAMHKCQTPWPVKLLTRSTFSTVLWVWRGEGISRGDILDLTCVASDSPGFLSPPRYCPLWWEAVLVISARAELHWKNNNSMADKQLHKTNHANIESANKAQYVLDWTVFLCLWSPNQTPITPPVSNQQ